MVERRSRRTVLARARLVCVSMLLKKYEPRTLGSNHGRAPHQKGRATLCPLSPGAQRPAREVREEGDPDLRDLQADVRSLERGLARLNACEDEHFRFEWVPVSVFAAGRPMKQYHVRDVGLILVGNNVRVAWADGVRKKRSDSVELEPLLAYGPLEVFSDWEWDKAAKVVRR